MHESVTTMWEDYLRSLGEAPETSDKTFTAWHFCNNQQDADALAGLVREGRKRATASCVWVYELEGEALPRGGNHSVILDWKGHAQAIIRTTGIDILPFEEVTEEFAQAEGEGDLSLDYWRKGHWHFFDLELRALGKEPDPRMPVLLERFEVVFGGDSRSVAAR